MLGQVAMQKSLSYFCGNRTFLCVYNFLRNLTIHLRMITVTYGWRNKLRDTWPPAPLFLISKLIVHFHPGLIFANWCLHFTPDVSFGKMCCKFVPACCLWIFLWHYSSAFRCPPLSIFTASFLHSTRTALWRLSFSNASRIIFWKLLLQFCPDLLLDSLSLKTICPHVAFPLSPSSKFLSTLNPDCSWKLFSFAFIPDCI